MSAVPRNIFVRCDFARSRRYSSCFGRTGSERRKGDARRLRAVSWARWLFGFLREDFDFDFGMDGCSWSKKLGTDCSNPGGFRRRKSARRPVPERPAAPFRGKRGKRRRGFATPVRSSGPSNRCVQKRNPPGGSTVRRVLGESGPGYFFTGRYAHISCAEQATWPSTRATASKTPKPSFWRMNFPSMISWSPGCTTRLKRALSMPAK